MATGYTRLQIASHWAMALLILANSVVSDGLGQVLRQTTGGQAVADGWHVWLGLAVRALMIVRVILRFTLGAPATGAPSRHARIRPICSSFSST